MKSSHKKAIDVLTSAHMKKKHVFYAKENQRVFYLISLFLLFISSFIVSFLLIPFILLFESFSVYAIVLLSGLVFGFIFSFMILDLQHLERKHHVFMGILVPAIAVANIYFIISLTKRIADFFLISLKHDFIVVSSFYLIGFILPYLFFGLVQSVKGR